MSPLALSLLRIAMPREIAFGGVLAPSVLLIFVFSLILLWCLDGIAGRFGLYRYVWHPPLFRIAFCTLVFGGLTLLLL
jgi:Protein of unknown function (DUF1656)